MKMIAQQDSGYQGYQKADKGNSMPAISRCGLHGINLHKKATLAKAAICFTYNYL